MKIKHFEPTLTVESVMRRIPTTPSTNIRPLVEKLMEEYHDSATHSAVFTAAKVTVMGTESVKVNEAELEGSFIHDCLKSKDTVFPFIITLGKKTDEHLFMKRDVLSQFLLDQIYTMGLVHSERQLRKEIQEKHGYAHISRLSPGSLDEWPISQQLPLFSILKEGTETIGVELDRNCIMHPTKSLSGIIFSTAIKFSSCILCPREGCPGREQQYHPEKKEYYLANI